MGQADVCGADGAAWRERHAARVLDVIEAGVDGAPEAFEPMSLEVFAYTRDDCHRLAAEVLGLPKDRGVNTLGLAESATNYSTTLRDDVLGRPTHARHKASPPWTRTQVFDIERREVCPPGRVGLLRHYDVCDLPTVIGVQCDNLGVMDEEGGFEIIGQAKGGEGGGLTVSSPIAVEDIVAGADDPEAKKRADAAIDAFQRQARDAGGNAGEGEAR